MEVFKICEVFLCVALCFFVKLCEIDMAERYANQIFEGSQIHPFHFDVQIKLTK